MGFAYEYGQGVEQDYEEAVRWYSLSADQGDAEAQCCTGFAYEYGQGDKGAGRGCGAKADAPQHSCVFRDKIGGFDGRGEKCAGENQGGPRQEAQGQEHRASHRRPERNPQGRAARPDGGAKND